MVLNHLCGINQNISNNININPDYNTISLITTNHNLLPILHNLFENFIVYVLKYRLSIWKYNYNKILEVVIENFINTKKINNIKVYEKKQSLCNIECIPYICSEEKFENNFEYIGDVNIIFNKSIDKYNYIVDLQRVYSYYLSDGMSNISIKFIMKSDLINKTTINYKSSIISLNHKGNLIMFSNIVNYY